jgi:predicted outer membrane repeat protein
VDATVTTRWSRAGLRIALALSAAWWIVPAPASAAGNVTLCQSDDQPGPGLNLENALQGGGMVTFSCGGQATIRITKTHVLTSSTIVDGRGAITLDAEGRQLTMFKVGAHDVGLDLIGITLVRSRRPQASGGGPIDLGAGGSVVASSVYQRLRFTLQSVIVRDNESPILVYGAGAGGTTLIVRNSDFRDNRGAALTVTGTASGTVMQCTFVGNEIGVHVLERVTVEQSTFSRHTAGAIVTGRSVQLDVRHSRFVENSAPRGGAITISGWLREARLESLTFERNEATQAGGAIAVVPGASSIAYPLPPVVTNVTMTNLTFVGNRAPRGGALDVDAESDDTVTLTRGLFQDNTASGDGGGLAARGGRVAISGSIFHGNKAGGRGSAAMVVGVGEPALVANSLIVRNEAGQPNGGAVAAVRTVLKNVTIDSNRGGGLAHLSEVAVAAGPIEIWNSIVAHNAPDNCAGPINGFDARSANLQFPSGGPCVGMPAAEPLLDPLFAPLPGSPVLGAGDEGTCSAAPVALRDVYYQKRDSPCSVGAVERAPEHQQMRRARRERAAEEKDRDHPVAGK